MSESKYKVGNFVIVTRRFAQEDWDGKKFRGRILTVNRPEKTRDPERRFWYEVFFIDIEVEGICYDDELEPDILQELAGS